MRDSELLRRKRMEVVKQNCQPSEVSRSGIESRSDYRVYTMTKSKVNIPQFKILGKELFLASNGIFVQFQKSGKLQQFAHRICDVNCDQTRNHYQEA